MDLSRIILGPVVTEKSERLKAAGENRAYTFKVAPRATKTDVKRAIREFYGAQAVSVRILIVRPKTRSFGRNQTMEKRHRSKRAIVTLAPKSKPLDLSSFKTS